MPPGSAEAEDPCSAEDGRVRTNYAFSFNDRTASQKRSPRSANEAYSASQNCSAQLALRVTHGTVSIAWRRWVFCVWSLT